MHDSFLLGIREFNASIYFSENPVASLLSFSITRLPGISTIGRYIFVGIYHVPKFRQYTPDNYRYN